MKLSQILLPLLKENPKEAQVTSHQLMLRAGMIRQQASGIYSFLPMGVKVLQKVENIVREEMNNAGAQEIIMPCIQPMSLWEESGRGGAAGELTSEMLKMHDRHKNQMLFAPTSEEVVCDIFRKNITSYKALPMNLYQIHWKFRDEVRPRFGILRGREFLMKDAYSFHLDRKCAENTYNIMMQAYFNAFTRMGLKTIPILADPGDIGGYYTQEFHVLTKTGESSIYYEKELEDYLQSNELSLETIKNFYAADESQHDEDAAAGKDLLYKKGIEVGQIFLLGDKYTKALNIQIQNANNQLVHPVMGTYGIGISRLIAAIIEYSHDDDGIIWPLNVAPFMVAIINLQPKKQEVSAFCQQLYQDLSQNNIEVLLDDTENNPGIKFSQMDLIGIPLCIYVGSRGLENNSVEVKIRKTAEKINLSTNDIYSQIEKILAEKC